MTNDLNDLHDPPIVPITLDLEPLTLNPSPFSSIC